MFLSCFLAGDIFGTIFEFFELSKKGKQLAAVVEEWQTLRAAILESAGELHNCAWKEFFHDTPVVMLYGAADVPCVGDRAVVFTHVAQLGLRSSPASWRARRLRLRR